jgi:hypothetical protein
MMPRQALRVSAASEQYLPFFSAYHAKLDC